MERASKSIHPTSSALLFDSQICGNAANFQRSSCTVYTYAPSSRFSCMQRGIGVVKVFPSWRKQRIDTFREYVITLAHQRTHTHYHNPNTLRTYTYFSTRIRRPFLNLKLIPTLLEKGLFLSPHVFNTCVFHTHVIKDNIERAVPCRALLRPNYLF